MSALDEIMKVLEEEKGNEVKVTVVRASDSKDDSKGKEEVKLSIKDSTRAAKLAKGKIMKYAYDQVDGLSGEEISDVLGNVGELCKRTAAAFEVDDDLGKFTLKLSKEVAARIVKERDESKGD